MSNLLYISRWFRGKAVSLAELLEMDVGYVSTLNKIAYDESKIENARNARAEQELQDAIHDEGG